MGVYLIDIKKIFFLFSFVLTLFCYREHNSSALFNGIKGTDVALEINTATLGPIKIDTPYVGWGTLSDPFFHEFRDLIV